MPRDWHKRKKSKDAPAAPVNEPFTNAPIVQPPSPTTQAVLNRIAAGGPQYLMDRMVNVLMDSHQLAEEPEFSDLFIDGEKTARVTERWLSKHKSRLSAAEKKGEDAYDMAFDDMRVEVINELATPAFRKEVNDRLQQMLNRLMTGQDQDKLELAMLLQSILKMKKVPWGVCGLILAVYERSLKQGFDLYEQEQELFDAFSEAFRASGEEIADPKDLMQSPDKLTQIAGQLATTRPDLVGVAEQKALRILKAFEKELIAGSIDLPLFSEDELKLPFERMEAELGVPFTETPDTEAMGHRTFEAMVQTMSELMTPERYQRFCKDVESTQKTWMRENNKWAIALQLEMGFMGEKEYDEDRFVLSAFFGQLARMAKQQAAADKSAKRKR